LKVYHGWRKVGRMRRCLYCGLEIGRREKVGARDCVPENKPTARIHHRERNGIRSTPAM
jgi:hypothetical protein